MSAEPTEPSIDAVLLSQPPAFTTGEAVEIGAATFGIRSAAARSLGSERDQTFLLLDEAGDGQAVLKVSNPAEDPATLDMEALVARHAVRADPGLSVAQPRTKVGAPVSGVDDDDVSGFRAGWTGPGGTSWVRAYDVLPGRARLDPRTLSDEALVGWGETTARLGLALRTFIHPNMIRRLPWDVQHAARVRPMLDAVTDPELRRLVVAVLDRYDEVVAPIWPSLRSQALHGDLTADNVLADDAGRITGIIDFGDLSYTALVVDLASVLDSLASGRAGEEMIRVARLVLDGYERVVPLEQRELAVMGELWAARSAVGVAIGSWRAARGLEEAGFATRLDDVAGEMMEHLLATGWSRVARRLGALDLGAGRTEHGLAERRDRVFGPAMESLSYAEPIEMAQAEGVWMTDTAGRRYLDMYNNVVGVGHAHPRVTSAVARQWRVLNTNLRYLHHGAVELAERLLATCPPGLDTVLFVNSGSEANDLAWRIARAYTGNAGGLCTDFAYHGVSDAIAPFSPETVPPGGRPPHVETWVPADAYRGTDLGPESFVEALDRLSRKGFAPAMTILDGVLQSDGVRVLEPAYVRELLRLTHDAGGLWVADEVQGGHGRTGEALWSFERFGITPDLVTLGKPMGNGQPVGAVITRRELLEPFARDTVFFSTFAGNQVSMAAAHAVLDVLADERVLPRVTAAGEALRSAVRSATSGHPAVGDVRGIGLANGIELVRDRVGREPDGAAAAGVANGLRRRGVLVGTTGRPGNVLKVRPPLAFTADLVPTFVAALVEALDEAADEG
jgi:4-aminobutyrate aminotransferase-like enzyme/Ser/Thr protein kinase RdoA (MazF antagonist)